MKDTVREEMEAGLKALKIENNKTLLEAVVNQMGLEKLLEMHPYDLSGGEQQRLGLAKLLLTQPDIILWTSRRKA